MTTMTDLLIARRDGVLRAPDGTQYRVHRGKTLAHAAHPAAAAHPGAFMPVVIDLDAEGADPGRLEDEVSEELAEAEAERDTYRDQLAAIVDLLDEYGYRWDGEREQGWLLLLLRRALTMPAPEPARDPEPEPVAPAAPVAPPRPAKKAAPTKRASAS